MVETTERKQFVDFLRDNGHRVTQERLTLFDEIFTLHGHIDAEELLESMVERGQKISRATVYRNLDLLVECGLVLKHRLGRRRYVFEHVHTGQRHDHLVCSDCGRVAEFVSPGIAALQRDPAAWLILAMTAGCAVFMFLSFWGGVSKGIPGARRWLRKLPKGDLIVYTRGRAPNSDQDYHANENGNETLPGSAPSTPSRA